MCRLPELKQAPVVSFAKVVLRNHWTYIACGVSASEKAKLAGWSWWSRNRMSLFYPRVTSALKLCFYNVVLIATFIINAIVFSCWGCSQCPPLAGSHQPEALLVSLCRLRIPGRINYFHGVEPFLRGLHLCSYSRTSQHSMESEDSLLCSQASSASP
jgi:hypothetical protein